MVDCRDGPVPLDQEVAKRLRYVDAPVLLVVNKADAPSLEPQADEFYRFGRKIVPRQRQGEPGQGRAAGRDRPAAARAVAGRRRPPAEPVMKVAIVGRRNVGKSTLVNTLAQAERMIISEVPGTTRDSVDVRFELDGKAFMAIDTPGFRRSKSVTTDVEFYSTHRAQRSIRRADVVLLFFDATQRISKVDKQLCDYIAQQYKPCMFVVNKWDLLAGAHAHREVGDLSARQLPHACGTCRSPSSPARRARTSRPCSTTRRCCSSQSLQRVPTAQLNKLVRAALEQNPPPLYQNRRPKIYYATQVAVQPPTIVLFCSDPQGASRRSTSATCCGCSATSWSSARCPSSSTSASANTATHATRSRPNKITFRM